MYQLQKLRCFTNDRFTYVFNRTAEQGTHTHTQRKKRERDFTFVGVLPSDCNLQGLTG